jgi:hypothetical protein
MEMEAAIMRCFVEVPCCKSVKSAKPLHTRRFLARVARLHFSVSPMLAPHKTVPIHNGSNIQYLPYR